MLPSMMRPMHARALARDTILRDGGIEAAHRVVDVGGRHKITGNGLREF
jgi:hypothetical protein